MAATMVSDNILKNTALLEALQQQDELTNSLLPAKVDDGILYPLKTNAELEEEYVTLNAVITRCPVSSASGVINELKSWSSEDIAKNLPHLRRCCKPCDLPAHIRCRFMDEDEQSRQIHNGKAAWVYIAIGLKEELDLDMVREKLGQVEGMEDPVFLAQIPLPMCPPTSQTMASLWCTHFWPTVYRKTNPQGPHPSLVSRATDELLTDAAIWMTLAFSVAEKGHAAGLGEAMGACIVMRTPDGPKLVALAADARSTRPGNFGCNGNPLAHAVQRAISMVAQKLVRAENRQPNNANIPQILEFDCFQDAPLLQDEQKVFDAEHPQPDGYLCHGLELYTTHEPCTMCSMAVLHSRMSRAIFAHRMPLTGGFSAEDRVLDKVGPDADKSLGGGKGLGLFWRRELNWSLLAWEYDHYDSYHPINVKPTTHV